MGRLFSAVGLMRIGYCNHGPRRTPVTDFAIGTSVETRGEFRDGELHFPLHPAETAFCAPDTRKLMR